MDQMHCLLDGGVVFVSLRHADISQVLLKSCFCKCFVDHLVDLILLSYTVGSDSH